MKESLPVTVRIGPETAGAKVRLFKLSVDGSNRSISNGAHRPTVRVGSGPGSDLLVDDPAVSRIHFEVGSDGLGCWLRDLGSTNGTVVDGYRTRDLYLKPRSLIELGSSRVRFELSETEAKRLCSQADGFHGVVGGSVAMRELFALLERSSATDSTILIEGESGTGKEVLAEAIHGASKRKDGPFVVFDCSAAAPSLLEAALFGHERGAFTGAVGERAGCLEEADGGTLFLDELGELPLPLQPKLLRFLEKRQLRRIGGSKTINVDVRVVAATNRDLAEEVNSGAFREDLYYRLAVVRVRVPPLRQRIDDLAPLVRNLLGILARDRDPESLYAFIPPLSWKRLREYPWRGNVRELRNAIERALAVYIPGTPLVFDLDGSESVTPAAVETARGESAIFVEAREHAMRAFESKYLGEMLGRSNGNISRAAALAGMDRSYFKRLLRKYPDLRITKEK